MKKIIGVLLMIFGIACIFSGGFVSFLDLNTIDTQDSINKLLSIDEIRDYSSYDNYNLSLTTSSSSNGISVIYQDYDMIVDISNKLIYSSGNNLGTDNYIYYDIGNNTIYYSEDDIKWDKYISEEDLPDFSNMIDMIKNDNITNNGDDSYTITTNYNYEGEIIEDADISLYFDSLGYLNKIVIKYDEKEQITYEFSNINKLDELVIPEDILENIN